MRKELWWSVAGYVASVAVLLSSLYWFLANEGFTERNFLLGAAAILILSIGWGYVIASHLIAPRQNMYKRLVHVTDDILHELKIPLSTIDTNASMIIKAVSEERTRKRLERIRTASHRLHRLYLELAYALRREIAAPDRETFDLAEMLRERAAFFNEQGRNTVRVTAESCRVTTDRIGLEQAIDNLIANAMKYSPSSAPVEVNYNGETLEVIDHGFGMDETQLVRIFERYYRGDTQTQGKGLGLALVKRFCDEHGIDIRIDSKPGEGTCVTLRLSHLIES